LAYITPLQNKVDLEHANSKPVDFVEAVGASCHLAADRLPQDFKAAALASECLTGSPLDRECCSESADRLTTEQRVLF